MRELQPEPNLRDSLNVPPMRFDEGMQLVVPANYGQGLVVPKAPELWKPGDDGMNPLQAMAAAPGYKPGMGHREPAADATWMQERAELRHEAEVNAAQEQREQKERERAAAEQRQAQAMADLVKPINILDAKEAYERSVLSAQSNVGAKHFVDMRDTAHGRPRINQEQIKAAVIDKYTQTGAPKGERRVVPEEVRAEVSRLMDFSVEELQEQAKAEAKRAALKSQQQNRDERFVRINAQIEQRRAAESSDSSEQNGSKENGTGSSEVPRVAYNPNQDVRILEATAQASPSSRNAYKSDKKNGNEVDNDLSEPSIESVPVVVVGTDSKGDILPEEELVQIISGSHSVTGGTSQSNSSGFQVPSNSGHPVASISGSLNSNPMTFSAPLPVGSAPQRIVSSSNLVSLNHSQPNVLTPPPSSSPFNVERGAAINADPWTLLGLARNQLIEEHANQRREHHGNANLDRFANGNRFGRLFNRFLGGLPDRIANRFQRRNAVADERLNLIENEYNSRLKNFILNERVEGRMDDAREANGRLQELWQNEQLVINRRAQLAYEALQGNNNNRSLLGRIRAGFASMFNGLDLRGDLFRAGVLGAEAAVGLGLGTLGALALGGNVAIAMDAVSAAHGYFVGNAVARNGNYLEAATNRQDLQDRMRDNLRGLAAVPDLDVAAQMRINRDNDVIRNRQRIHLMSTAAAGVALAGSFVGNGIGAAARTPDHGQIAKGGNTHTLKAKGADRSTESKGSGAGKGGGNNNGNSNNSNPYNYTSPAGKWYPSNEGAIINPALPMVPVEKTVAALNNPAIQHKLPQVLEALRGHTFGINKINGFQQVTMDGHQLSPALQRQFEAAEWVLGR